MAGIDNLKSLIKFILTATEEIATIDTNKDHKVSFTEALASITQLGIRIPSLVSAIPNIKEEWKDLTREELDELVKWFSLEFDIPATENGKLEAVIKRTAGMLVYNYNYYRDIREIMQGS